MQFYRFLANQVGTQDALDLANRLVAWHDAMVAHERAIKREVSEGCDQPCPHDEALDLWREAQQVFGPAAAELAFLRAQAEATAQPASVPQEAPQKAAHDSSSRDRASSTAGAARRRRA
jgi:hypothetical protein